MPKRKAASKLSRLVDDDLEDDLLMNGGEYTHDEGPDTSAPPAKKAKGRPKITEAKATAAAKPNTRKARSTVVVGPKRGRPARGSTIRRRSRTPEDTEEAHETPDASFSKESDHGKCIDDESHPEPKQQSDDELDSPGTTAHGRTREGDRTKSEPQKVKRPGKRVTIDDGFEYTPMGSRHPKSTQPLAKENPATKSMTRSIQPGAESKHDGRQQQQVEEDVEEDEAGEAEENQFQATRSISHSPIRSSTHVHLQHKPSQTANQRRKPGGGASNIEKGDNEATLRRKLGDMTKKYENMDMKYRNLREVGILEANSNVEKLRKQCESNNAASNELIASLKKELTMKTSLAKESHTLQKQLQDRDDEIAELEAKIKQLSSGLTNAQNEIKGLQTKLAASRTAATNVEYVTSSKGPGSAAKTNSSGASRTIVMGSAEAAHVAQIAQLKEDLYSDLTGLIIRDAKKQESDHLYDCIQTGINGTLHFKLAVAHDSETKNFEEAEFHYFPLLDPNRDRDLVDILPEYLSIDITFPRQHASVFYSRLVDTLTKKVRRADD
ncbi:chromosome segregation protein (Pcs1) [Histoplasma ohiense]|nr:chromosome segregation protein (Pcs1) [Histoplasma ohiense (nom. inval.)]